MERNTCNKTFFPVPPLRLGMTAHASPSSTVNPTDWWEGGVNGPASKGYMFALGCGLLVLRV